MSQNDDNGVRVGVTVLGSGSRGNATVIHTAANALLLDAGFSAQELDRRMTEAGLDPALLRAVIVSHEHGDHVNGLRVLTRRLQLPIYTNRETAVVLRQRHEDLGQIHLFSAGTHFRIGDFDIEPFSIPHDANDPVGFIIRRDGLKIGVATDLGHANRMVSYHLRGCDLLIVESNHSIDMVRNSNRPWSLKQRILGRHGHLSNNASVELLRSIVEARTRHLILAHLSEECNEPTLVQRGIEELLEEIGRPDVQAHVACQKAALSTVWL